MLISDNKFDEFTRQNIKNKHDACISTPFGQCLETNQRTSVHVWRKIEHVRPPQTTQCIPYELLLHTLKHSHPSLRAGFYQKSIVLIMWLIGKPHTITHSAISIFSTNLVLLKMFFRNGCSCVNYQFKSVLQWESFNLEQLKFTRNQYFQYFVPNRH
jgi:hypothetical protein